VPVGVVAAALIVIVEEPEPGAAIEAGLNFAVAPAGSPDALNLILELNGLLTATLTVVVPGEPCATVIEVGETETTKRGMGRIT
jgi:hypothetical protein